MSAGAEISLSAISDADLPAAGAFLNRHLNTSVSSADWVRAMTPAWSAHAPNHGFMLREGEDVVGVYLALYSEQPAGSFCNLGAWCVTEEHRAHGLRLLRAVLGQKGYHFTDFSPSGNVVELNRRMRFVDLDTSTALAPHLPLPRRRGVRVVSDHARIETLLQGRDRQLFEDHRDAAAAIHLVLLDGERSCYVVARRDRRKGLPLFASLLHVGDRTVFPRVAGALRSHLLLKHRVPLSLLELRVTGHRPRLSFLLRAPRSKMFRSPTLGPDDVGYLYSELTCVAW